MPRGFLPPRGARATSSLAPFPDLCCMGTRAGGCRSRPGITHVFQRRGWVVSGEERPQVSVVCWWAGLGSTQALVSQEGRGVGPRPSCVPEDQVWGPIYNLESLMGGQSFRSACHSTKRLSLERLAWESHAFLGAGTVDCSGKGV